MIFDANANPHNTPESLRWRYTASAENNATNTAREALIETRAPDHTATTVPREKGRPPRPDEA